MKLIAEVKEKHSVTIEYCCQVLKLEPERYRRWVRLYIRSGRYGGGKPGPKKASHALLPREREMILKLAKDDSYADLSHRQLAVVASETNQVEASSSTFYREMKRADLMEIRRHEFKRIQEKPEVKPDRPNQVWSWDLTYIALGPIFVYLFAIIDTYSRKIVGWHLSFNATVNSMKLAWDNALSQEGLLEVTGVPQMPLALSDHGVQMAKKTAKQFFKDLGIKQLFARYQTPQDNSWIESWFRILKYDWLRFKDYVSFDQLREIIIQFVQIYNHCRYHGAIGYVTPQQKHADQADKILAERAQRKRLARLRRLEVNRNHFGQTTWEQAARKSA